MSYKIKTNGAFFAVQKAFSRHLLKYPWQLMLALIGVSIGIAVIVAIQLVRVSAYESFELATLINTDSASHQIAPQHGSTVPSQLYVQLKRQLPYIPMSPVVDFDAKLSTSANNDIAHKTSSVYVLGIDPISQANRLGEGTQQSKKKDSNVKSINLDIEQFMSDSKFAAINAWTSENLQLSVDDPITLNVSGKASQLIIRAVLPNQDQMGGLTNNTLLVDIATAQEILGLYTEVTRINIDLAKENLSALRELLPADLLLIDNAKESARLKDMTRAFYTNLTALSLMALMMGVFLIYNTETFLVLQRQQMIARLKAIGVTNKQIFKATLLESAGLGFIGSIIGLLLGYFLAKGLLTYVSVTLNDLYFQSGATEILLAPWLLCAAVLLGVIVTACAGFLPARAAAGSPLANSLNRASNIERKSTQYSKRFLYFAVFAFVSAALGLLTSEHINGGFFAIACSLLGFSALCIPVLQSIGQLRQHNLSMLGSDNPSPARIFFPFGLFERIGIRTVGLGLSRAGTASAALMIATAAGIGIGVMVASFRASVSDWLASSLRADYYVSASFSLDASAKTFISAKAKKVIEDLPEVLSVSTVRRSSIVMYNNNSEETSLPLRVRVSAFELNPIAIESFKFLTKETNVWQRWENENVVLVTEPFAYHNKLGCGDILTLGTASGRTDFRIIGIYKDYASEQGGISMNRSVFDQYWDQPGYNGIGIYSSKRLSFDSLQHQLASNEVLKDLKAVSSNDLYSQSLEVFDRTFLITNLLKVITVVVAFIGIIGALLAQQLERSREYGIYRALGFSRWELLRVILAQTMAIGLTSAIIAIPAGLSVAWILIEIVNPRSFGWTMTTVIPVSTLVTSFVTAIAASVLAGIIPALRISKLSPADALRYE